MTFRTLDRTDVRASLITGLTTGVIAWQLAEFLLPPLPFGFDAILLVPLVPVLWLGGVQLGYTLSRGVSFFLRFGRFAAIGFTNAAVDFGVLFLLIGLTGYAQGLAYALFKTVSFMVASAHSYVWNKYWAFDAGTSHGGAGEATKFFAVALVSVVVNVIVATAIVAVGPLGDLTAPQWAGIGAVFGSASALIFSFIGYKLFVFHK
jgi:putative flippase GtrA